MALSAQSLMASSFTRMMKQVPPNSELLRGFSAIGSWHPHLPEAKIEGGDPGDRVGAVRAFSAAGGHRERLVAYANQRSTHGGNWRPSPGSKGWTGRWPLYARSS
jgi:hypothetical protein